jgi:murein DD-endopeptidase MepM/ murein hydrolase activator NlpD
MAFALLLSAGAALGAARMPGLVSVPVPPPSSEPLAEQGRRWVAEWARTLRMPPQDLDADALVATALASAQPNEPREAFFDRLGAGIGAVWYGFAPLGATHDDAVRYRLPFPLENPRFVAQGANGRFTHQGAQAYSFDFAMPVGSPVLAAREGTVARVRDGSQQGGLDPALEGSANEVWVLHADGTFAAYVHLQPGIPVREGQAVKQGDPLGASGNTGYTAGPHLHFAVQRRSGPASVETVPIRFGVGSPKGFVPEQGQFYGGKPRQTVQLLVASGGAPLGEQNPLRLAPGAKAALAVQMASPGLPPADVTLSPATRFFSPTGWSMVVDERGGVTASPTPDYAAAMRKLPPDQRPGSESWGVVVVSYEDATRRHFGFASVPVLIGDAKRP